MIEFSKKYKPLFELLRGKHPEVDTVIMTGGRGSAKSFAVSTGSMIGLVENEFNILYTRFTNVSITDSIKPEVEDKIELLGYSDKVNNTKTHIEVIKGGEQKARIAFKGIKTGSKQQTANLKSLSGFNVFVIDEAEEIPDFATFEKVFLSIRSKEKQNITILILNPTSVHHWIYKHFFEDCGVTGGANTIKDNVMYIHTSYLDVKREHLAKNIVNYYKKLKKKDPARYENIVGGGWTDIVEGKAYTGWKKITNEYYDKLNLPEAYAIDWGKSDPFAILKGKYDKYNNRLYLKELHYESENLIAQNASDYEIQSIRNSGGIIPYVVRKCNIDKTKYIVCDSVSPTNIEILNDMGYEYAYGVAKGSGSILSGVQLLQSTEVFYTNDSVNIDKEYSLYCHKQDRLGYLQDQFIDQHNHLMDCARYLRKDFDSIIALE